jgi:galactokinase
MGSHTDYNDGCVLTLAIDRAVEIAGPARGDRRMSVRSTARDEPVTIDLDGLDRERLPAWARYVAGVAWALEQDGYPVPGGDLTIASDVPVGAGLSSSAALECATATWFEHASGAPLDPLRKARLCQRAENEFVGVNCGILDQYTSVFGEEGRALLLDCRELEHRTVTLPTDLTVVIGDTRAPRTLAGSEYGERRAACEAGARTMRVRALRDVTPERFAAAAATLDEVVRRRCAFIVAEQARVIAMAGAIEAGDRDAMGRLMDASFAGDARGDARRARDDRRAAGGGGLRRLPRRAGRSRARRGAHRSRPARLRARQRPRGCDLRGPACRRCPPCILGLTHTVQPSRCADDIHSPVV